VLDVERWAELRRMHFVKGLLIREISRRTGIHRDTISRALKSSGPPRYRRPPGPSKLDPFKEEIHRLLGEDPKLPGTRLRELIAPLGYAGGKTILDDYLREVRPLFAAKRRTYQRTAYRPGEICQFDLWRPSREIPVGFGQTRVGYVVVACLGYSRAGSGALVFSKQAPDILWGISRCLYSLGGLPNTLVWDREGALHASEGRPSEAFAAFCGELRVGWRILEPADPESKGIVERLQGFMETTFEPGRCFAGSADFQLQLDDWFCECANARHHRTLRCRPVDRLAEERAAMAQLPEAMPDLDRRLVTRVPADPHVRVGTNDYSLDPRLVGRRVELRVSQSDVSAVTLDTGEPCARHQRSFARHRTITALEHRRTLREMRGALTEADVEARPLARYDALIPA
jgi:transposase